MLKGNIYSTITFYPIVTCQCCRFQSMAGRVSADIKVNSFSALEDATKNALKGKMIDPPVGWSVNGRDAKCYLIYRCPNCFK